MSVSDWSSDVCSSDLVTSVDMLRMAESLNAKVVIPVHYDIWSNFMADPKEITEIWKFKIGRASCRERV